MYRVLLGGKARLFFTSGSEALSMALLSQHLFFYVAMDLANTSRAQAKPTTSPAKSSTCKAKWINAKPSTSKAKEKARQGKPRQAKQPQVQM